MKPISHNNIVFYIMNNWIKLQLYQGHSSTIYYSTKANKLVLIVCYHITRAVVYTLIYFYRQDK